MMIAKLQQLGTESKLTNTLSGVWLKIWNSYWVHVIPFICQLQKLFNLLFQPNRFLHLKLKLYIASSCGRIPNNSVPAIKTRIFIFCFTFCTVCNWVNKSQLSMEEEDENLMLSGLENGSAHSENNEAKQKRKPLLKGVSTEFSQH